MKTPLSADRRLMVQVDQTVVVLFALVTEAVGRATAALLDEDVVLAQHVIDGDKAIDQRCDQLTALVKEGLAEAAKDPEELETLIVILQIIPELERSADLAEHIARRTLQGLGGTITPRSRGLIQRMSEATIEMWQVATVAYRQRSRDAGLELQVVDDKLDGLAAALAHQGAVDGEPQLAADLALIARFYERLGDHAVNLARRVDVMAAPRRLSTSRFMASRRPEPDEGGDAPVVKRGLLGRLRGLRLVPTNDQFFDLFLAAAGNARDAAEQIDRLARSFPDCDEDVDTARGIERRAAEIRINLLRSLDESFITPYDREDIHALTEAIDDVVGHIFAAASLIRLVGRCQPPIDVTQLTGILGGMAQEMVALMGTLKGRQGARYRLEQIERLQREGDAMFRRTMARLYSGEYEVLEVMKWKDIVQAIVDSIHSIEHVSDVVETILVKNS